MNPRISRRQSILAGLAAGCAVHSARAVNATWAAAQDDKQAICVFTKPFNSLSYDELADRIAELGFQGVEAPIRSGGHVDPEKVEEQLPKLVEAMSSRGMKVTLITTDINDARDPLSQRVLKTAADVGITRYRMKYLQYDLKRSVIEQIAQWRPQLLELAELNQRLSIRGLYQNHAGGKYFGAALWDLHQGLDGISTEHIGVAYDIRHATVEGGTSWPITFNMIRPHIDTVYVKDFVWSDGKVKNVPLGEGLVSPSFFELLAKSNFDGPISLHEEYLDHKDPDLVPSHLAAMKQDLSQLRKWLALAGD